MRPTYSFAAGVFSAVLLTAMLGTQRSTAPRPPVPTTPESPAPASDQRTVAWLESRLAALERAQSHVESAPDPSAAFAPPEPKRLTPEEIEARAEAADQRKVERLEHALAVEARDPAWADPFEQDVMQALALDAFAGNHVKSLACGRSVCRLEVEHDDEASRAAFEAEFAMAAPANQGGFFRRVRTESGRFASAGYIARSGSTLLVDVSSRDLPSL